MLLKHKMRYISTWCHFLIICVKTTPFEMSVFMFLVSCLSCFDSLCFVSITFKLEYLLLFYYYCYFINFPMPFFTKLLLHLFFLSLFFLDWYFFLFFFSSLALFFLSCPLFLLSPTFISVFLLLLPLCNVSDAHVCSCCLFHFIN